MTTAKTLVSAAQVARLAGVTRATVSNWRRRHMDFPAPAGGDESRPVYDLREVRAWLAARGQLPPDSAADELAEVLRARRAAPPWPLLLVAARLGEAELAAALEVSDDRLLARAKDALSTVEPEMPGPVDPPADADVVRLLWRCVQRDGAFRAADVLAQAGAPTVDRAPATGTYVTPAPVAELMAALLAAPDGSYPASILDPACGGGGLLAAAVDCGARHVSGQDAADQRAAEAAVRLRLAAGAPRVDVRVGDSLRQDAFRGVTADAVLCNPPYGQRDWGHDELAYDPRWSYGLPARGEPELAWVQHCLAHLVEGGTAVLLMPPAAAERPSGRRVRAALARLGALRAVTALPAGIAPPRHVGLHLWLVRRPRLSEPVPSTVLFVDMSAPDAGGEAPASMTSDVRRTWLTFTSDPDGFEAVPGTARAVPVVDLLDDLVDLTPARQVHAGPVGSRPEQHADTAEAVRTRLRRATAGLAALSGGTPWTPAGAEPHTWRTAAVGDLLRGGALTLARPATGRDDIPADVDIQPGDIVLTEVRRDGTPAATVADDRAAGRPPGRGTCLLRPDPDRFDPWFLAGFLSAEDNVHAASTGTSTVRVDVRRLRVPLLSLDEQRRYGKAFRRLHAMRTAADLAARLADETTRALSTGLTSGALLPPGPPDPEQSGTSPKGTR